MTMHYINKKSVTESKVHLSFRDILLVPYDDDFCSIKSRQDPDISAEVCPGKKLNVPLLSAPMDTVTGPEMAIALDKVGCLGVHTRFINNPDERNLQVKAIKRMKQECLGHVACAVGVKNNVHEHVERLCDVGLDIVVVDIANGNHIFVKEVLDKIVKLKDTHGLSIIAGNVATGKAAVRLAEHGADCAKIGIGSGGICITRRVTGFGVPQLTAIMDCRDALDKANLKDVRLISDGGIRHPGDAVKALWAGSDTIMCGYIFSGHSESCNQQHGRKEYRGMSSRTVSGRADVAAEGVSIHVENKGPVKDTVREYAAAIKAGLSMANANNLSELRKNVRAIRVSTISNEESDPVRGTPC